MSATDANIDEAAMAHTDQDDQFDARREAEVRAVLEARAPLKQQIDALVATHQNVQPPPFTSPELIIMAIIVSKNEFCTKHEILDWVEDTFPYWAKLARNGETANKEDHSAFTPGDDAVHYMEQEFLDTLRAYELPLIHNSSHYAVKTDIALVNRQLARETIPIFYGENHLSFSQDSAIANFVKITSPRRLHLIKKIDISVEIHHTYRPFLWREPDQEIGSTIGALSKAIPSLPTLTVNINCRSWQYDRWLVHQLRFKASKWSPFDEYSSLRAITKLAVQTKQCRIVFDYEHHVRHE